LLPLCECECQRVRVECDGVVRKITLLNGTVCDETLRAREYSTMTRRDERARAPPRR
jgi:hypothetical protein